jgi:hypothetical protein
VGRLWRGRREVVVDGCGGNHESAEDLFGARIAGGDMAVGGFGDENADGDGTEDGVEAGFAAAEGFFGFFVVVDIFEGSVPTDDFALGIAAGGGACAHPPPGTVEATDAVLDINGSAGAEGFFPRFEGGKKIVRVEGLCPTCAKGFLLGEACECGEAPAGREDESVRFGSPGNVGIEFDGVAVVVFAFGEGLFGSLEVGDIYDGNGDAYDFVDLITGGLKGDEMGAGFLCGVAIGVGITDFEPGCGFAIEGAEEIGFVLGIDGGKDLRDVAAEVGGDGEMVDLGEAFVDADVAEIAVEEAEADGDSVVDGVELGEALGGKGLEAERETGVGDGGAILGGGVGGCGGNVFGEGFGELFGGNGTAVEPALADIAAQPEEHVGDSLGFDALGDGGEVEGVSKTDDGCGDLSGLAGVIHRADEAGVDFDFVEGEELEMAEAGVAGAEVVEGEAGAVFLELVGDAGGGFGVADEGALGDLEDKAIEGEVGLTGGGGDVAGKGEIGELGEGDVDGDGEVGGDVFGGGEDGSEERAGEEAVEAGVFGEGDELVGKDEAALRMLPAGEGFEAAEQAGAKFHERLEIGDDLAVFQGSAQIVRVVGSHGRDDTTAGREFPNENWVALQFSRCCARVKLCWI